MRAFLLIGMLLVVGFAGCLSSEPQDTPEPDPPEPAPTVQVGKDGTLELDVAVDVVLVGFPSAAAAALKAELDPLLLEHDPFSYFRGFATDRVDDGPQGGTIGLPLRPTAVYEIVATDLAAGYWQAAEELEPGLLNATAAEAWLHAQLDARGLLDPDRETVVLVAGGPGGHGYQYHGNVGYLQDVRVFGEHLGFTVFDVSAAVDPYVGSARDYMSPLPTDATRALGDLVRDLTEYRVLQGPIYPNSIRPCHAVTLILGVRAAALTDVLPGFTPAAQATAVDRLANHFRNLTGGDDVFVDFKLLHLPVDDPPLDAITRESTDLSAFRYWLDENWADYWVAHEGCEPYVSFALYGDVFDQEALFSGIAMYDVHRSHRISFSIVSDQTRIRGEWPGLAEPVDGYISTQVDGRGSAYWFNRLFSHETGHLFGQPHPHNVIAQGGAPTNRAFSAVWSTMSYQVRGVVDDFGTQDNVNWMRNRAAYAHKAAFDLGLTEDPAYQEALDHFARYAWRAAGDLWVDLVAGHAGPVEAPPDGVLDHAGHLHE